ncbi:unnamed protein product [Soboliphyme baturini]|uniref:INTS5_C domain-containing protein n=1 Tax=Soboliphyme baturini TaxID=241478 RepID=A0A183ILZ7_9BILA|nr:unnamed protein product [Soboliphyme baturini]
MLFSLMVRCENRINRKEPIGEEERQLLDSWFSLLLEGKLLGDPWPYIMDMLTHVSSHEAFIVLCEIWRYFQDALPDMRTLQQTFEVTQLQLRDVEPLKVNPEPYLNRVRPVLQANIATLGGLYRILFRP